MNEIHIPYKATAKAKWRLGQTVTTIASTELVPTPAVEEQCPASYRLNEDMTIYQTLPSVHKPKLAIAIKDTNTPNYPIEVIYFKGATAIEANNIIPANAIEHSREEVYITENNLLVLSPPEEATFCELVIVNFIEFFGKPTTGNDFVARYEKPTTIHFNPETTLLLDCEEVENSAVEIDTEVQKRLETRLANNTYPIYGIRLECNDMSTLTQQAKKGITILTKEPTGELQKKFIYFRVSNATKIPVVELLFDTPLLIGKTTHLELDFVEGEGTLSLQLEPQQEVKPEEEADIELRDFDFPIIRREKEDQFPTKIILGGLLLIAAIVLTAE